MWRILVAPESIPEAALLNFQDFDLRLGSGGRH